MTAYPYTHLFQGQFLTVVTCGPHIQVLDTATGALRASTANLPEGCTNAVIKSGPILCARLDDSFDYLATSAEDKKLKIWKVSTLQLLSESRELPKRPTAIQFTSDAQTLLVSDKFGDIFSYPFTPVPVTEKPKKDALSSHENPSGGELILGHTSFLTDFCLSNDCQFIITADRDEHIRVSWYPQGYVIESFCLGHKKFVSALHIPPSSPIQLISGGGDPVLKIWDWKSGRLQYEIPIVDLVEPFIKMTPPKRKKGEDDNDGEGRGSTKRRKKKGKGKAKSKELEPLAEDEDIDEMPEEIPEPRDSAEPLNIDEGPPEKVLVIGQLGSLQNGSKAYIIWRAVGASAIFACSFPGSDNPSPRIITFDFGTPVLNFSIVDAHIYVTLDASWPEQHTSLSRDNRDWVRLLRFESDRFAEVTGAIPLLDALNSTHLLSATTEERSKLDLYSDLTALPKRADFESNLVEQEAFEALPEEDTASTDKAKSKKALGRLKSKKAVAKVMASGPTAIPPTHGDAMEPGPKRVKQRGEGEEEMETDP
ncbi:WD40 repeat-like protein [Pluteus cervinus]|uniref:WD40 repeat-like protein n=1 Tax=Pluteus cervinus TaxID=181527 RepID=A0ACD3B9J6_9AGAR|nr:WD40 repeat-like protein [Pluteus cervinus]